METKTTNSRGIRYSTEALVKNTAREIGLSEVGIAGIQPTSQSTAVYDRWIADGKHGDMRYLSGGRNKRHDPGVLLDGARSAVCVALNYHSERAARHEGGIAMYAHGPDYHVVLRDMLEELKTRLLAFFPDMRSVVCVDTEPISERDFAVRAGIAWLGKNTCVISKTYGSWIFLGELITDLDLAADQPLESMCGTCTKCIDVCPTGALEDAFSLDATKCISYLTIEKRGEIPEASHRAIGGNVYGCDECQTVCPFNKWASDSIIFSADTNPIVDMPLEQLASISDEDFRELTRNSAMRRAKAEGLRRNARIVLANKRRG